MRPRVAVVGAGAAGLMAAIHAARRGQCGPVVALDGARTLGAKILVSGGGRCNVTHHAVDESAFAGSTRLAIRKVLRRFDVAHTVDFFADLGVALKRDRGSAIERADGAFLLRSASGERREADRVVLAPGGCSLPKTGSDGHGYAIARSLGHSITPRVFPGLVPLTLPRDHPLCALSGLSVPVRMEVRSASGRRLTQVEGSLLCTHFGLSGPAAGVPLAELRLETMESRVCRGLYLCGEICDVDGRIGGFNFQWAWASGYVAGVSVGAC